MSEKVEFELVSPERLLISQAVDMVVVPGSEGDFGALPRHAPMITSVRPGVIAIYEDGDVSERIFVAGGFAEVTEARVTVLAEEAVKVSDLNHEGVATRLRLAEEALEEADTDVTRVQAQRALVVARAMQAALGATVH